MSYLKKYSAENRAIEDFKKVFYFSQSRNENFVVLSVDIQRSMFESIFKKEKTLPKFIEYSKKIQELSKKNKINFLDIKFKDWGLTIFEQDKLYDNDKIKTYTKNKNSAMSNLQLLNDLNRDNVKNVFVFGLFRQLCIFSTILDLIIKKPNLRIITCFTGTVEFNDLVLDKEYILDRKNQKSKIKINNYNDIYEIEHLLLDIGNRKYTLRAQIEFLRAHNVLILDYFYKDSKGNIKSDLDEFSGK
jgi:hypothetical protein